MQKPIVVVGSINLDLVVGADHIPQAGETVIGRTFETFHGGKGANQAVAVAKLGYPVCMVGNVGSDPFGAQLRKGLDEAGVGTDCVAAVEGPSGVALITTGARAENNIVVVPGANDLLTVQQLQTYTSVLERAGIFLAQLEIPMETVEWLAAFAEERQIPLMLDPAPARELSARLLHRIAWITPNESEIQWLLKLKPQDVEGDGCLGAIDRFLSFGVSNVLLKLGSRGCVLAERDLPKVRVPAFAVTPVDTTAAGDAFNGAFAVALMQGQTAQQSAAFASAVAAISVTRPGAQPSMPRGDEVNKFLRERPATQTLGH